jgi:AcrR family transcriptional regulator
MSRAKVVQTGDSDSHGTRRELALKAALTLFNDKGYRATTLNEIAARLNLSGPALYYYFPSKQDILVELIRRPVTEMQNRAEEIVADDDTATNHLIRLMRSHLSLVFNDTESFSVLVRERIELPEESAIALRNVEREYELLIRDVYLRGISDGEFKDLDVKVAVLTILGSMNWALRWYDPQGPLTGEEVINQIIAMFLAGVSRNGEQVHIAQQPAS